MANLSVKIIDPDALGVATYPSVLHGNRICVAVPHGRKFAVRSEVHSDGDYGLRRIEYVVAVDGRDTLTNKDASRTASGVIGGHTYTCKGFRTGTDGVREFVSAALGEGATTAERNGTAGCAGVIGVVAYAEKYKPRVTRSASSGIASTGWTSDVVYRGGPVAHNTSAHVRGHVTLCAVKSEGNEAAVDFAAPRAVGPTSGAAAGAFVEDHIGETKWERGERLAEVIVEYDSLEGWAARGVSFEPLTRSPWVADAPKFCDPQGL